MWYCRVCGLDYDVSPWGEEDAAPDYSSCACCGVEFGYEDYTPASAREYRRRWIANGAKWFLPRQKPANWQVAEQLKAVPRRYR